MGRDVRIRYRIWIEIDGEPVLGKGGANLLKAIEEEGSLSAASRKLGVSYVFAWEYLQRINEILGTPVVETRRGGRGGGTAKLTEAGEKLLALYEKAEKTVRETLSGLSGKELADLLGDNP